MRWLMRKCPRCGRYTLSDVCPVCGARTVSAHPHRFSPEDRFVHYRVLAKYGDLIRRLASTRSR
ncbi:MAG: RNA-protein complex protein Nop10 [Thermoprotei archaeon]|nr:MAG: RNA-protein complex protein Nop10 [Thermoprotei archaeon]